MDEKAVRLQCLELAVSMARADKADTPVALAESFWQWLNGSHDAAKTPNTPDGKMFAGVRSGD